MVVLLGAELAFNPIIRWPIMDARLYMSTLNKSLIAICSSKTQASRNEVQSEPLRHLTNTCSHSQVLSSSRGRHKRRSASLVLVEQYRKIDGLVAENNIQS